MSTSTEGGSITATIAAVAGSVAIGGAAGVGGRDRRRLRAEPHLRRRRRQVSTPTSSTPLCRAPGRSRSPATSSEAITAQVLAGGVGRRRRRGRRRGHVRGRLRLQHDRGLDARLGRRAGCRDDHGGRAQRHVERHRSHLRAGRRGLCRRRHRRRGGSRRLDRPVRLRRTRSRTTNTPISPTSSRSRSARRRWSCSDQELATIDADTVAASLAVSGGFFAGVSVAGAATTAQNAIKVDVDAHIANSTVASAGAITVTASRQRPYLGADRLGLRRGGLRHRRRRRGGRLAIANNAIADGSASGAGAGTLTAYVHDTPIQASGALQVGTNAQENIFAQVGSLAAALSGGFVGVSLCGSGRVGDQHHQRQRHRRPLQRSDGGNADRHLRRRHFRHGREHLAH